MIAGLLFFVFIIDNVMPVRAETRRQITPSPTPTSTPSTSWNVESEFRTSPNNENPNRDLCNNLGVWSFMESVSLTHDPLTYTLMANFTANGPWAGGNVAGLNHWRGTYSDQWGTFPFVGYNATGTTQVDGLAVWQPNTMILHPAPSQMSIIGWKSHLNGYVSVTGGLNDIHRGCGDGVSWFVEKNSTNLASGTIPDGGSQAFSAGTGGAALNTVAVNINDMLYVMIAPNGNISCDSTGIDLSINVTSPPTPTITNTPTITYTPSRTPTASKTPTRTSTASRTPTASKTPTASRTPTASKTFTPTITFTPSYTPSRTPTITYTPTNTLTPTITPTPNRSGSGTCWSSGASWPDYNTNYSIESSIPTNWVTLIESAATTWTNITPSHFSLSRLQGSPNFIAKGPVNKPAEWIAITNVYASSTTPIILVTTTFDETDSFDIVSVPSSYQVEDVITHEFGHWLQLEDISTPGCEAVTMWHSMPPPPKCR